MVRNKNALFDRKMPNPAFISYHCHYQTSPTLPMRNVFFPHLLKYFVLRTHREIIHEKWNYIDIQIYLISLWNMKCKYSFPFVMIIMSAAIDKYYWCGSLILPTSVFSFDCSNKIWHTHSYAGSIMHSTVSKDRVSCRPHLEHRAAVLIVTRGPIAWLPLTVVTSCLEQANWLTKASMIIARVDYIIVTS